MLKIQPLNKGATGDSRFVPGRRLWLSKDGQLVEDGDPRAASLYCSEFAAVNRKEYDALTEQPAKKSAKKKRSTKGK